LLRLAEPPAIFDARWSEEILAEMSRTLVRRFAKSWMAQQESKLAIHA
jgi:hypothetical protein